MSQEEIAMKIAIANLEFNGKQMIDYVADNKDNLYDAILDTAKRDTDFIVDLNEAIELLNTMLRTYLGGEKNEKAFKQ